jgi:two-component system cell cycle response regulator
MAFPAQEICYRNEFPTQNEFPAQNLFDAHIAIPIGKNVMLSSEDILNANILIVDDLKSNVMLLEEVLRDTGYTSISSTTNSSEVCELHRAHHYDLILLDLMMPGMDGFQVMEGLKAIETDGYLPVLMITAEPGHKLRALKAGAKDFMSKPFDLVEVQMRIHNMLEVRLLYKKLAHYTKVLESFALHDSLTELPNRRLLMDRLALAIVHARRNNTAMAILYLDLDGFKAINDTLGHDAGDMLLKMVAERLIALVREEDTVARLGGDEFVIALWQLDQVSSVGALVSKIIEAISQPYYIQNCAVTVTTSVGIGIYPMHGEDVDTLMKSADLALYDAKHTGKNTYRISARTEPFFPAPN